MSDDRYLRQTLLTELGEQGQEKLRRARVLVVGAGGLGSPVATVLAGAGVGTIGIVDDDTVGLTNLHRQLLYSEADLGQAKASAARKRLLQLNSGITVNAYPLRLDESNATLLLQDYDVAVDCTDNFRTRFLLDKACQALQKPYVYGAVGGWEGQVSVFHWGERPRSYRDLFPDEQALQALPEPGKEIMATTTGTVGNVMAQQVLELIGGFGEPLAGRLWTVNLLTLETAILEF